jgi:hypothetical protein
MSDTPLKLSSAAASHFANDKRSFESLIDAIAVGDVSGAIKAASTGGIPHKDASLMVRDSSALAAAVLSMGDVMSW